MTELEAVAEMPTDAAEHYAEQLRTHLGHKVTFEPLEGDLTSLAWLQDVLKRHLERFDARRGLHVQWRTEPST